MHDVLLVNRCKNGDRDALRQIYEKYKKDLLILATAFSGDVNLAEDAVHDTFVKFAKSVRDFKITGSLKGYLAACAVNRVRDLLRAERKRGSAAVEERPAPVDSDDPSQIISVNEQLRRLSFALSKLPEEQREAVVLRTFGQMRFTAIAASSGVSVNTVKGRYRYGIEKLRSLLNGELER